MIKAKGSAGFLKDIDHNMQPKGPGRPAIAGKLEKPMQRDRSANYSWEIDGEDLALIEKAEIGGEHAHLFAELQYWKP
jgi:hypothetical protein